jgi:hypothetical protein
LKRIKIEDKSKKYIFIGYDEMSRTYNLYDPIEKKLMVSKDVEMNDEAH